MQNTIKLDQIFYGHNGTQYRILTSTNPSLNDEVETFCQQIGTPTQTAFKPFLFSIPIKNRLFMILGQAGKPDRAGRTTLSFHAFAANLSEAQKCHLNAFVLWEGLYFQTSASGVLEMEIPPGGFPLASASTWDGQPCLLRGPSSDIFKLRELLGNRINDCGWSSFSFQKLPTPPFSISILSDSAPHSAADSSKQQSSMVSAPAKFLWERIPWKKVGIVSLLVNILLFFTLAGISINTVQIRRVERANVMQELKNKIPKEFEITDWEQDKERGKILFKKTSESDFVKKLDVYVSFVNNSILEKKEKP